MYEDMWKRDCSAQRKEDAELFIKEAFVSPLEAFGAVAPGAYLGAMSGRNLGGELAHGIAPKGHKTKSKERARNIAVPLSAAGAIAGGLMQPGKHKVRGALLRHTSMSPSDVSKIMKYGYPTMAGLAAGTAAGVGTGGLVGGYHRLKGGSEKRASKNVRVEFDGKVFTGNSIDEVQAKIEEFQEKARKARDAARKAAGTKASDSFGKVHSKAFRGNKKKVVVDNPKTLKRIGQVGLVGLGAVGAGLAYKKYKDSKNNEKTAASASTIRNRIIGGSAALGALGLGTHEALKSRVLPSGVTQREAEVEARRAQDARYEELTQKKRNKLVRAGESRLEALGQRMDQNKGIAIPAKALAGAAIGGYSAKKALDFVKRNARYL